MTALARIAKKRVLVTGHTGFKGAWLTQILLDLQCEVAGYSLYIPSEPSLFEVLNLSAQIKDYRQDIRNLSALKNAIQEFQPEIIFHLAAQPIVSTSYSNPVETFETNVMGMVNILEAIRSVSSVCAAVLITSDKCYENVEWEYGYRESDKLGGKDPYSASKAAAEIVFSSYVRSFFNKDSSVKIATARAGNVIGGGDWAKDRIIPDSIRSWSKNSSVTIRSPYATRPWQHVLEPLAGYLTLASQLLNEQSASCLHKESFNFGPNPEVNITVIELLELLKNSAWKESKIDVIEPKDKSFAEAGLLRLCCDKALSKLSWTPTLTLNETVNFTASWYKLFYTNPQNILNLTREQIKKYFILAQEREKKWLLL